MALPGVILCMHVIWNELDTGLASQGSAHSFIYSHLI